MVSMTLAEAAKLSRNPLAAGIMLGVATTDEMLAMLPFVPKPGESFIYNREKALASAEFVSPDHTSLTESASTFDRVIVPIRILASDVDVYNFAEEQMGETNSQRGVQVIKKAKAAGRAIASKAISGGYVTGHTLSAQPASWGGAGIDAVTAGPWLDSGRHGPGNVRYTHVGTLWAFRAPGDVTYGANVAAASDGDYVLPSSNPNKFIVVTLDVSDAAADGVYTIEFTSTTNEPDGLLKMLTTGQTISAAGADGDALSFSVLDELIDEKVKVRERLAFVMNGRLKRKYFALVRALGGTDPVHVTVPGLTGPVPSYRGIPILQNDNIPSTESKGTATTLSSVLLASFVAEEGFWAGCGSGALNVEADPRNVSVMGFRVRDVGDLEQKDAKRTRVTWYGAFALGSELAAARAKNIITA